MFITYDKYEGNKSDKKSFNMVSCDNDDKLNDITGKGNDELPLYFKSHGFICYYDWDNTYSWYEVKDKKGKLVLQIEEGTTKDYFIQLLVEFFTDDWDFPPIFWLLIYLRKNYLIFVRFFQSLRR